MRLLTLTLADLPADLPANVKGLVRLTQARAALADLDNRVGEYSWPITLPATRNNARIFTPSALHPLGLGKFQSIDVPYRLTCESQVFTGTFRLTSLKGGYTGQLLGEGFSWALALGEKKLTDLRFEAVEYDGSQLETILGLDCDATDLQFPLCSFGNFFAPPLSAQQSDGTTEDVPNPPAPVLDFPLSVDDYPPGVYYRNVLQRIFSEIGFGLSGRVLDEAQWRQTVITPAGADLANAWPWGALLPARGTGSATTPGRTQFSYYNAGPAPGYTNTAVGFDESATVVGKVDGFDVGGECFFLPVPVPVITAGGTRALNGATATYTASQAGTYTLPYSVNLVGGRTRITGGGLTSVAKRLAFAPVYLVLLVRRGGEGYNASVCNGAPIEADVYPVAERLDTGFNGAGDFTGARLLTGTASVYLEPTDTVQLCVVARRRLVDVPTSAEFLLRTELVLDFGDVAFGCSHYADNDGVSRTNVQPADFLPPLSCKDVVRDFLKKTDTVPVLDPTRRVVHLLARAEQAAAAGPPVDLSALVDAEAVEYGPTCGAGVGALVFKGPDGEDPLLPAGSDTVRVAIGPASGEQTITGLFAPVAFRLYRLADGRRVALPTMASQNDLDQNRSEVAWDVKSQGPRLVRYTGADITTRIPYLTGTLPLATSAWDGALCWAGLTGAVATYYQGTVQRAVRGHLAKCPTNLTPALYRALTPGRSVLLFGARYQLDGVSNYDLADEANQTTVDLLRSV